MKSFNCVFRHKNLYDIATDKRILIKEDAAVIIVIEEDQLLGEDPYNKPIVVMQEQEQTEDEVKGKAYDIKLIASINDKLKFMINAGKNRETGKYAMQCTFTVKLLSKLYMIQKNAKDKSGLVNPCPCVVESVSGSLLKNFEPVYAYSLNDAYTKTYESYFNMFGKSTVNVYNIFYLVKGTEQRLLGLSRIFR